MNKLNTIMKETKSLSLLYVEDNEAARESTLDILKEFFDTILVGIDGLDGLEKFKSHKIDVVITDINMPKMNGLEMLEEIRKISTTVTTLVFSAYNETEYFIDSIKLGVNGYVLKPIDFDQFLSVLNIAVEKVKSKRLENLLLQYKDVTDSSSIMSIIGVDKKITYVNDAYCRVKQCTKWELIGENESDFNDDVWDRVKEEKKIWKGILQGISKNLKPYYLDTMVKPIVDARGEIIEYIALRHDVTAIMNPLKQLNDLVESSSIPMIALVKIEAYDVIENFYTQKTIQGLDAKFARKLFDLMPKKLMFDQPFVLGNGEYAFAKDMYEIDLSVESIITEIQTYIEKVNASYISTGELDYNVDIIVSFTYGEDVVDNAKHGIKHLLETKQNFMIANDLTKQEYLKAEKNIAVLKMVKEAIENKKIISYFQAIIDNKSQKIVKYESLVRLVTEEGTVLSPYFFLETSKKGKYYTQITSIVLDNSFEALSKTDADISINISALDIENKEISKKFFDLLAQHKKSANRIIVELLEDENFKDFEAIKVFISQAKEKGVRIAIDDFGSGYSNFERLLDYQPDILKIDASLIKNIVTDKFSLSVVKTMVSFAKEQNLEVIAEYVENEAIYNLLKEIGVDYSQGYYFGKPEPLK